MRYDLDDMPDEVADRVRAATGVSDRPHGAGADEQHVSKRSLHPADLEAAIYGLVPPLRQERIGQHQFPQLLIVRVLREPAEVPFVCGDIGDCGTEPLVIRRGGATPRASRPPTGPKSRPEAQIRIRSPRHRRLQQRSEHPGLCVAL